MPPGGNRAERRAAVRGGAPRGTTAADRYGRSRTMRRALLPAILAAGVLLVGVLLLGTGWYLFVRFAVAILAAVMAVFAVQAKAWWWLPVLAAAIVFWNPVLPIVTPPLVQYVAHPIAAVLLFAAGATIREPYREH